MGRCLFKEEDRWMEGLMTFCFNTNATPPIEDKLYYEIINPDKCKDCKYYCDTEELRERIINEQNKEFTTNP